LLAQHEAGKLRILATSGLQRSPMAPNIPTFKESGLNLAAMGWNTFFAPAAMPTERVSRYASAIHAIMKEADTRQKFKDAKMIPVASSQIETASMLKAYRAQWAPIVQKSGYQP
jgi:tripartite-type tricarboxylate transporter receptor subunit TctC